MRKQLNKRKVVILIILITVMVLLTEHIVHKYLRDNNYFKETFEDPITPGKPIVSYDENELTEDEFNKLFYGEDYESEVEE